MNRTAESPELPNDRYRSGGGVNSTTYLICFRLRRGSEIDEGVQFRGPLTIAKLLLGASQVHQ